MLSIGTPNEKLHKRFVPVSGSNCSVVSTVNHRPKETLDQILLKHERTSFRLINRSLHFSLKYSQSIENRSSLGRSLPPPVALPLALVLAGPSGVGKSTLINKLKKHHPGCFGTSVSHTTRKPRDGEQNGKEYHFVEVETFEELIKNNGFLEHTKYANKYYGTSKQAVQDVQREGKICIFDVEIDGVKNLKKTGLRARYVFVSPPNMETLEERLRRRGTETEESLRNRLNRASEEIRFSQVEGMFDLIIENNCVDQAYQALESLLMPEIESLKLIRGNVGNGHCPLYN